MIKNSVNVAAKWHPSGRRSREDMTACPHPPYVVDLACVNLWLFLEVQTTDHVLNQFKANHDRAASDAQERQERDQYIRGKGRL